MARHPLWARAPLVLRHWPAILLSIGAGALLLGATAASPRLFLSSSATDALDRAVRESTRYGAGITIALRDLRAGRLAGDEVASTAEVRDRVLARATAPLPHLGDRILTILGDPASVTSPEAPAADANPVRLVYRTGSPAHVDVLARAGDGVWIQDVTADALRVSAGDRLVLESSGGRRVRVRVGGVYESLANSPPDPFWEPLAQEFRPPSVDAPLPPPFVLSDRETVEALLDELGERDAEFQWEYPLALRPPLDVAAASSLVDAFRALDSSLRDTGSRFGRYFETRCATCPPGTSIRFDFRSTLEQNVVRAKETAASLSPSIDLLAFAGLLSALVVLGAAGLYDVNRRRTEIRFLTARGMSPAWLGAKTAVECLVPVTCGAAVGLALSAATLARWGPGAALDRVALVEAGAWTALMIPLALAVIGVSAAVSAGRLSPDGRTSSWTSRIPWEIAVLGAAALALRQVLQGEGLVTDAASDVDRVSSWLLVFPVLFVAGGAGLVARTFRRALVAGRGRERRTGAALYLALNRLAGARWLAIMLITASALAFGVYLFAQTMTSSVRATTVAKSHVFTGSDVSVPVDRQYTVPSSFPWPSTIVGTKLDGGRLEPSGRTVDFLAVDIATFERAAFWDPSFASVRLEDLLRRLAEPSSSALKVIVAGELPLDASLEIGGVPITLDVVARVDAFPGQFLDRTLLVVNKETAGETIEGAGGLDPVSSGGFASMWIKGDPNGIVDSLGDLGFGPDDSLAAATVLRNPAFVAVSRTFAFLEAIGALAALLVLVGTALYVQVRQRGRTVSYALARRMGLRARSHYTALVIEIGAMLLIALVAGAVLGAVAAKLVYGRVDLLPNIPPHPLLRVPYRAVLPIAIAVAVTVAAGAWHAHRSAERADVPEALRSGA